MEDTRPDYSPLSGGMSRRCAKRARSTQKSKSLENNFLNTTFPLRYTTKVARGNSPCRTCIVGQTSRGEDIQDSTREKFTAWIRGFSDRAIEYHCLVGSLCFPPKLLDINYQKKGVGRPVYTSITSAF